MEEAEFTNPAPRKHLPDRSIYSSRIMEPGPGPVLLSDFGETRLGPGPHTGDIMPLMYRAPEVLLRLPWSYPADIWSVALTVSIPAQIYLNTNNALTIVRRGTFSRTTPCSVPATTIAFLMANILRR